jgi:ATPase subunit of ABC transporter with duplicated ATPase domains
MTDINIHLDNIDLQIGGKKLLLNTTLKIANRRRYGLIGYNGSGKTTLLSKISKKTFKGFPDIDILYLEQEVKPSDKTVFETVIEANKERYYLVKKYNKLSKIVEQGDCTNDQLDEYSELSQKLIQIGAEKDKGFLRKMLIGLGFNREEQEIRKYL